MDKKLANNLIVGVFVIIGSAAFLFILFTIGEGNGVLSRQDMLYGKFANVKGLNFGSEVSLAGLRVGTIKKISISNTDNKELTVEMSVSRDMMDKLRQDSVAAIRTSGVLGDRYIELTVGSPGSPPLKNGDAVRTEEPEDLFSKGGTLVESVAAEFKRGGDVNEMVKNLNKVSQNLATITTEMRDQKGLLHEIIYGKSGAKLSLAVDHLEGSTAQIEQITKKINGGQGSLGALINDPSVYEDLKAMMGGARRSSVLKYFMQKFISDGSEPKPVPTKK